MIGRQTVRWGAKAVFGLAANIALLTLWVDVVGLSPEIAIIPNWVILSVAGYVLADKWVFSELAESKSLREHLVQFAGSESIMLSSKLLNYGIYLVLLRVIDYRVAWIVGAVVTFVLTFVLNRRWWARQAAST